MRVCKRSVLMAALAGCVILGAVGTGWAIPPDPDNAALLYYQGFLALPDLDDDARDLIGEVARGNVAPNDKVREHIGQCQGAIEFVEAGAAVPTCHWGFRFSQGFDALMPQLSQARLLTFILVADARIRAADGDYRGALERCLLTETFSRHIGDDTLISYLVSIAVKAAGYGCMDDVVGQAVDDVALLQWLKRELSTGSGYEASPVRPLKFEREIGLDTFRFETEPARGDCQLCGYRLPQRPKTLLGCGDPRGVSQRQRKIERVDGELCLHFGCSVQPRVSRGIPVDCECL